MEPIPENEFQKLLADMRKWKRDKRAFFWLDNGIYIKYLVLLYLLAFLFLGAKGFKFWVFPTIGAIATICKGVTLYKNKYRLDEAEEKITKKVEELAALQDGRAVPLLLETLKLHDAEFKKKSEEALPSLLSLVREEHASLYTEQNRTQLYDLRKIYWNRPRADRAALIHAIGQVGDKRALHILENPYVGDNFSQYYITLSAEINQALLILNARLERERTGEGLLRASVAPVAAPETLLRPASYAETTELQQLLRASQNDTE